jgi:hypothetical protein
MSFPLAEDIDDLTDAAIANKTILLIRGLSKVSDHLRDVDPQYVRDLYVAITEVLDEADGEDSFGTEGWRHFVE